MPQFFAHVFSSWRRLSLAGQFALLSSVLIGVAMFVVGWWVSHVIEDRVLHQIGASRALYLDSFISPLSQDLAAASDLNPGSKDELSKLVSASPLGRHVVSMKIWAPGGRIVYSSNPKTIGKSYPVTDRLARAYRGEVSVQIEEPRDEEHELEQAMGRPLFEIFSPLREQGTDHIIGAAELYEIAEVFKSDVQWASIQSWLVVGSITAGMIAALFSIVQRGSRTIVQQKDALVSRVAELSRLLTHNRELQERVRLANATAANVSEQFLSRIGADLHDGPAQHVSLGLFLLDRLKSTGSQAFEASGDYRRTHEALSDALAEIRHISAGLASPKLDHVSPAEAIQVAVRTHERRTGTCVKCKIDDFPPELCPLIKTCLYRFVQEGLNNAFRHARGQGQSIRAWWEHESILVEVVDSGPGIAASDKPSPNSLGLAGLRARIEALGGNFELQSWANSGTRLTARFKILESDFRHG